MKLKSVRLLPSDKALELTWPDGEQARFNAIWLRDNSQDPETRSPTNGQRLITVLDIPIDLTVTEATITSDGSLRVIVAPEMKELSFTSDWLKTHSYDRASPQNRGWLNPNVKTWGAGLQDHIHRAEWDQISNSKKALGDWLAAIRSSGVAVLHGLPIEPGSLCDVAELFGFVRETNYGRWFEVRSEINPSNLAYTNMGLQAHTDNPYRDPVPTMQLLACLENSVEGGNSIVVDGFSVAEKLQSEYPKAFDLLSKYCANFEYAGSEGVCLRARKPMIELAPDGELTTVRFNNRSAAAFRDIPFEDMEAYYDAYRKFAEIVELPEMQVSFKLTPGDLFVVDNTRVLHARNAFSGSGTRWLEGCYADLDGLYSTLADIEETQNE